MPKILIINPVGTDFWNKITYENVKRVINPDTVVVVRNLGGAPPAIECDYDKSLASSYVVKEVKKANDEGYDAIIINCFDDPGLEASREISDSLVLGAGETSIYAALNLGFKVGIISTGEESRNLYYRKAIKLGLKDRIVFTSGIKINVLTLRNDLRKTKEELKKEITYAKQNYSSDVIVLGCTGFAGLGKELTKEVGLPVIDPTLITVKLAEAFVKTGLSHSKINLFNRLLKQY